MIEHRFRLTMWRSEQTVRLDDDAIVLLERGVEQMRLPIDGVHAIAFRARPAIPLGVLPVVEIIARDGRNLVIGRIGQVEGWRQYFTRWQPGDNIATFNPLVRALLDKLAFTDLSIQPRVGGGQYLWPALMFVACYLLVVASAGYGWLFPDGNPSPSIRGFLVVISLMLPGALKVCWIGRERTLPAGEGPPAWVLGKGGNRRVE